MQGRQVEGVDEGQRYSMFSPCFLFFLVVYLGRGGRRSNMIEDGALWEEMVWKARRGDVMIQGRQTAKCEECVR